MHKFVADTIKNRYFMQMEGFYTEEKMRMAANEAMLEAKKMKPGFTIINDSADLHIHDMEGVKYLGKMMEHAKKQGVKTIIRLVKDKLSQAQLQEQSKKSNIGIEIIEVTSVDEVEEYLNEHDL